MATATISYTGPADGQQSTTFTHTGTTPDQMAPAFFLAYREDYGNYWDSINNVVTPSPNAPDGTAFAAATDAQIFDAYCQGIAAGTAARTTRYLQDQAKAAALASLQAAQVTQTQ